MVKRILCLLLCLMTILPVLASCQDPDAGKLILAEDGASDYRIILSALATEEGRATAGEFQSYFEKITGVRLPIESDASEESETEILIGQTSRGEGADDVRRNALGEDGFVIRTFDKKLLITGKTDRGTLYGVYAFLEKYLGVRYWAQGVEKIPRSDKVALDPLGKDDRQVPQFEFRLQTHEAASDFNEKQHLNVAWESGQTQPICGGITYTGPWYVHTFGQLLGWNAQDSYRKQPCLSDNKVYLKMLEAAKSYLEKKPGAKIISLSQNDSTLEVSGECECDACKAEREKYGSSGALLRFVNRLARALKSIYPDVLVETLAYYYTQEPPKGGVKPDDNVIIRFCNASGCMQHSFTSESQEETGYIYADNVALAYRDLQGWAEITDRLYIWDYDSDFGSVLTCIPNLKRLYENIHTYASLGVKGVFVQGMPDAGEFDHLRGYLTSKLLWDPKMSYEEYGALIDEFCEGYYGPAAEKIKEILDYSAEVIDSTETHPAMAHDASRFWPLNMNEAGDAADRTVSDRLRTLYDEAVAAADTYETERRVRRTLTWILYYETLVEAMEARKTGKELDTLVSLNETLYREMNLGNLGYIKETLKMPTIPNFKNTLTYWGEGGSGIFDEETHEIYLEEKAKAEEKKK